LTQGHSVTVEAQQLRFLELLPTAATAVEQGSSDIVADLSVIADVADHLERRSQHVLDLVRAAEAELGCQW